jgi:hypothetical protein
LFSQITSAIIPLAIEKITTETHTAPNVTNETFGRKEEVLGSEATVGALPLILCGGSRLIGGSLFDDILTASFAFLALFGFTVCTDAVPFSSGELSLNVWGKLFTKSTLLIKTSGDICFAFKLVLTEPLILFLSEKARVNLSNIQSILKNFLMFMIEEFNYFERISCTQVV